LAPEQAAHPAASKRLGLYYPLVGLLCAITLLAVTGWVLVENYTYQLAQKDIAEHRLLDDAQARASTLSYLLQERHAALETLAGSRQVAAYFENKALGMSMTYGLRASVQAIGELFRETMSHSKLRGQDIYEFMALLDVQRQTIVRMDGEFSRENRAESWTDLSLEADRGGQILLVPGEGGQRLLLAQPVSIKQEMRGYLLAGLRSREILGQLMQSQTEPHMFSPALALAMNQRPFLYFPSRSIDDPWDSLPAPSQRGSRPEMIHFPAVSGTAGYLAIWAEVEQTTLQLVALVSDDQAKGSRSPWLPPTALGLLTFLILAGALRIWHSQVLTARLEEKALAQEALRRSEENFRLAFHTSPDAIAISRAKDGRFLDINQGFTDLSGYTKEEVLERTSLEINLWVDPQDSGRLREGLRANRKVTNLETTFLLKDGRKVPALVSAAVFALNGESRIYSTTKVIEEQKRAEEALKISEERYRLLVESANEGIVVAQDGMIKFLNFHVVELTGFTAEECTGRPYIDHVHPEDRAKVLRYQQRRLEGDPFPRTDPFRIIDKQGRIKWLQPNGVLIEWEGRPATLGFFTDITDHKQAQQALFESEERFRTLLQSIPSVAVQGYGPDGTTQYWNKASERFYGYTDQEALGRNLLDLIVPPEMADAFRNAITTMVATGEPIPPVEQYLLHKDGSRVEVFSSHAVVQRQGSAPELFCMDVDISELKRTADELRKNQALTNSIVESSADCIKILDLEGRLQYMSPGGLRMMGITDISAIQGKPYGELWGPLYQTEINQALAEAKAGGRGTFQGYCDTLTSESKWYDVAITPIKTPGGVVVGLLAISRDQTQAKMVEDRIKGALAEKEVLLKEIHHRVKNNLQVVSSLLKLQAMQAAGKRLRNALRDSQTRIQAMALVHESLYRSESLATVDLEAYISRLADTLLQAYPEAREAITLNVEAKGIEAGIDQAAPLGLILNELLTNSLKYAFCGTARGHIDIQAHSLGEGMIELIVADDGVGLPPELDWRSPPSLGLQLVNDLVEEQLEGSLELLQRPGACFRIKVQAQQHGN
jgi:PAS domain S-box-containing protein